MVRYPTRIAAADVLAILRGEHYHVTSPYEAREWVSALPGARWLPKARAWRVRKRWHRTLGRAIARHAAEWAETRARVAEEVARSGVNLAAFTWAEPSSTIPGGWDVKVPYHEELVPRLRALGGRWRPEDKAWRIPSEKVDDLTLSAPVFNGYVQEALDRLAAQKLDAERQAEARAWRLPVLLSGGLAVGALVQVRGEPRIVTNFGAAFEPSPHQVIAWGGPWAHHEGEFVCYAYTRAVGEEEAVEMPRPSGSALLGRSLAAGLDDEGAPA